MKKITSLILTLVMMFSLCVSVGAITNPADITAVSGETTQDVTVNVTAASGGATVYYVVVKWDSMVFDYRFNNAGQWNPETHEYDSTAGAGWYEEGAIVAAPTANIKVINHSNAAITANVTVDGGVSAVVTDGVTATLTNDTLSIGTAVGTGVDETGNSLSGDATYAPCGTATLTVSGAPTTNATQSYTKQVKVAIS